MAKVKDGKVRLFSLYIDGLFSKVMKAYMAKSAKHAAKKAYSTREMIRKIDWQKTGGKTHRVTIYDEGNWQNWLKLFTTGSNNVMIGSAAARELTQITSELAEKVIGG